LTRLCPCPDPSLSSLSFTLFDPAGFKMEGGRRAKRHRSVPEVGSQQRTVKELSMPRINWDDGYLIGIQQFDDDHKLLVQLLGEVYNAFLSRKPGDRKPQEILDSLAAYTVAHFGGEEEWMRDCDYPRREQHILEHKAFILRLSEFQRNFREGTGQLTLDIISYLRVWLLTHIAVSDSDLGVFQRESGRGDYTGQSVAALTAAEH
jgi:hemerythrin